MKVYTMESHKANKWELRKKIFLYIVIVYLQIKLRYSIMRMSELSFLWWKSFYAKWLYVEYEILSNNLFYHAVYYFSNCGPDLH